MQKLQYLFVLTAARASREREREREDGVDAIFFDFFNHLSPQESVWNWFRTGLKSTLISNQFGEGFDQIDMPITKMFDIIDFMIG